MITAEEAEYGTEEPHSSGSDVGLHPWEEQQLYSYHREQMLLGNTEQLQRRRIEAFGLEASAEMAKRCKAPPGPPRPTETAVSFSSTPPTVSEDIREEVVQICNLCYIWCNGDWQLKMHYMSAEHKTRVAIAKRFFGLWKIMTEQSEAYLPSVRATAQPSHFQGKGGRKGSGIISALNITAESIASTRPLRGGLR